MSLINENDIIIPNTVGLISAAVKEFQMIQKE